MASVALLVLLALLVQPCLGQGNQSQGGSGPPGAPESNPNSVKETLTGDPTIASNWPGYTTGTATTVFVGIRVSHLYGVDSRTKTYKMSGTMQLQWNDTRLNFEDTEVEGFDKLVWDTGEIWTPRIFFQDTVATSDEAELSYLFSVDSGRVRQVQHFTIQLLCSDMEFSDYPWDSQSCTMDMLSLTEQASHVKLVFLNPPLEGLSDVTLGEWDNFQPVFDTVTENRQYFDQMVPWAYAKVTFSMSRRTSGVYSNILMPATLVTVMSYSGYWINPAAAPGRIALAMICVLATISHRSSVLSRIPVVAYNVWVDDYLIMNLSFNFVAVVSYAAVNYGLQCKAAEEKRAQGQQKKSDQVDNRTASPPPELASDPPDAQVSGQGEDKASKSASVRMAVSRLRRSHLIYVDHAMRVLFPLAYIIGLIVLIAQIPS